MSQSLFTSEDAVLPDPSAPAGHGPRAHTRDLRILAGMLIVVVAGVTCLFALMGHYRLVALNLFYLPIILAGYFLGRTHAGALALMSVLAVAGAATLVPVHGASGYDTPAIFGLSLALWSASLGLAALLVGTLCDERARTVTELQRAYVGVAEVLARYLQGHYAPRKSQTLRVADLSCRLAEELGLTGKQADDVRVAALLHDLASVEITTRILSKAVDAVDARHAAQRGSTFAGTELVNSLANVLEGALPLLASQDDAVCDCLSESQLGEPGDLPLGAEIIRVARQYDRLTYDEAGTPADTPAEALRKLRTQSGAARSAILDALEGHLRAARHAPAAQSAPA